MEIPILSEFAKNPDQYYAAIGRRFAEIVAQHDEGTIRDPQFVDKCLDALEQNDLSLLESLGPQEQIVMRNLYDGFKL